MDKLSRLLLQSGKDIFFYKDNNVIYSMKNPSLKEIIDLDSGLKGEYFKHLYCLVSTSLDVADLLLCEAKIWYEDIKSEWEFFIQKAISNEQRSIKVSLKTFIDDNTVETYLDGIALSPNYRDALNFFFKTSGEYVLWFDNGENYNPESVKIINVPFLENKNGVDIYSYKNEHFMLTAHTYRLMLEYLKKINWIKSDYDFLMGGNKYAKTYILKHNYKQRMKDIDKEPNIDLSSIVSSIVARGNRYEDVLNYSIYLIYDIYYRLVKIDEWNNTMQALNSGCVDTKKNPINWEKINWSSII